MKEIITNINNLKESDITDFTTKVKILLINSNKEVLLAYSNYEYQFPGGTQEEGERLEDTLKRELFEETGIELDCNNIEPFVVSIGYYKDWPTVCRNKKVSIYYYKIQTDLRPNLDKMNLTENEINGNFELRYIPLEKVIFEINKNSLEYGDKKGIAKEMINLFEVYNDYILN